MCTTDNENVGLPPMILRPTARPQAVVAGILAASVAAPLPRFFGANDEAGNFVLGRINYAETD